MTFLHLILAHLLGDFVFQSNDLIQKKYKSWTGTFQHVCIIGAFTILALLPYWHQWEAWLIIGTIFGVHFVQDCLKIELDARYNKKKSTFPFFADQILHVTLIYFLSPRLDGVAPLDLPNWLATLYNSEFVTVYLIGAILISYTYDITLYQFFRQKSKRPPEYKANIPSMLRRITAYTLAFVIALILAGRLV